MKRVLAHSKTEFKTDTIQDHDFEDMTGAVVTVNILVGCLSVSRDGQRDNQHAKVVMERVLRWLGPTIVMRKNR
jgi:hypothetical protein